MFNNEFFDQVDGVAMGSPLGPVLANIFMGHHETNWIKTFYGVKPEIYKRYVDDIFCLFQNENEAMLFFEYLNNQHVNISFTFEKEIDGNLSFLDVLIKNTNDIKFETSIFRKKTFTGLLMNFLSFVPRMYKIALVKTLINRVYCICNTWAMFDKNCNELKKLLSKNLFPPKLIDEVIKNYLDKNHLENKQNSEKVDEETKINCCYFKLPYLGEHSDFIAKKMKTLCQQFCKNTEIKLSFTMFKVGNMFSVKCKKPEYLKAGVVYHFICAACNSSYVGETSRYYKTRVREHLHKKSQPSSIFKHLENNPQCRSKSDESCFKIIDTARTKFTLEVKEALHTLWIKPDITKQINLFATINA